MDPYSYPPDDTRPDTCIERLDFAELHLMAGGDVAQLVERCFRKAEAGGSNPLISTRTLPE